MIHVPLPLYNMFVCNPRVPTTTSTYKSNFRSHPLYCRELRFPLSDQTVYVHRRKNEPENFLQNYYSCDKGEVRDIIRKIQTIGKRVVQYKTTD